MIEVLNKPVYEFLHTLRNKGVLVSYPGGKWIRMVTHYGVSAKDIDEALTIIESIQREK
jgi:acetylornithine/succinyldiaminopimelate/putrescine aminotransferase